jgi:hypothetical protein
VGGLNPPGEFASVSLTAWRKWSTTQAGTEGKPDHDESICQVYLQHIDRPADAEIVRIYRAPASPGTFLRRTRSTVGVRTVLAGTFTSISRTPFRSRSSMRMV